MNFTVTVTLTLSPLTLAQLDTFLTAGIQAIPGAEINSVKLDVEALPPTPGTMPAPAG